MPIRLATPADAEAIAQLHARVLDWSINGRVGLDHIRAMYRGLFAGDDVFAVVAEHNGRLLGFMLATTDFKAARARFRREIGWAGALRVVLYSWRHPADWIDIAETMLLVVPAMERSGYKAELLAWVTEPDQKLGRAAAVDCMRAALRELLHRGHDKCLAQVLKPNVMPNKFHARIGSKVLASYLRNTIYLVDCRADLGGPRSAAH